MADHPAHYLSVEEATDLLRVTAHTVYRWCRSGRLKAVKVGKEWRIPAGELRRHGDPSGLMPLDALLNSLVGKSEHLVGVTWDQAQLERLEATFFESAAAAGCSTANGRAIAKAFASGSDLSWAQASRDFAS